MRGSRDFYKERFGLGERLAVRLAALVARKVELTAAAIEMLRDSEAFQRIVLHPELLDLAEELDTETLLGLTASGDRLPAPVVVSEREGWRTIALEEELVAEEGGEEEGEEPPLPVLSGRGEVLHPSEIHELFTRRDIAELELVLRTSADPNEKITAIRRLALSPAAEREKLALFAMALTDREAQVRSEAAEALTTLGLAAEVAEDARALAEGNERQKRLAAQRIGGRIPDAADAEMGVLLRIIAGTLRHEPSLDVRRLLIRAIEGACKQVAADARSTRDLVRVLLGQLRDAVEELGQEVRRVLLLLGRQRPDEVYALLQAELETLAEPPMRRVLVAAAGELAGTKDQRATVCRQAVQELVASSDPAVECLALVNTVARMGKAAVAAIEQRLLEAPEAAQETFVRLLDVLATRPGASKSLRAKVGRLLLAALERGERAARLAVVRATAPADPAVAPTVRRRLAAALLRCVQEYANPGIIDAIEVTVAKLRAPAVEPLLEALRHGQRPRLRASAARILGDLGRQLDEEHAQVLREAAEAALELLEDGDFPARPALARSLGEMCGGAAADEQTLGRVAQALRRRVLDKEVSNAALEGLGHLCLCPRAPAALKVELVDFFDRLLSRELPDVLARDVEAEGEIIYDVGAEVSAYTEMVPGVIAGLRNIATTSPGVLREQALEVLLRTWRAIAEGELQLGPGNTAQLLEAFRAIGTLEDLAPRLRERIADAVALRRDFLPTYRVLAELCVAGGGAMASRAGELAEELLEREMGDQELSESEHAMVLGPLVRLATAGALGRGAGRLRERIVEAAMDAQKRELEAAGDLLEELRGSSRIPKRLKKRLAAPRPQR